MADQEPPKSGSGALIPDPNDLLRPLAADGSRFRLAWLLQRFLLAPITTIYYKWLNRMEFHGLEHLAELEDRSFILCPNHTSAFDSWVGTEFYLTSSARFWDRGSYMGVLADLNRLGNPWLQLLGLHSGVIPVNRHKGLDQFGMADPLRLLTQSNHRVRIIVYPEGTRSKTGRLNTSFKGGVGWLVAKSMVPVLPIYHYGFNQLPGTGNTITVAFGKPLHFQVEGETSEKPATWIRITREIMAALGRLEEHHHPEVRAEIAAKTPHHEVLAPAEISEFHADFSLATLLKIDPDAADWDRSRWDSILKNNPSPIALVEYKGHYGILPLPGPDLKFHPQNPKKTIREPNLVTLLPPLTTFQGSPDFFRRFHLPSALGFTPLPFGVSSPRFLEAVADGGGFGFLGCEGLPPGEYVGALEKLHQCSLPFKGCQFIANSQNPAEDFWKIETILRHGITAICASAPTLNPALAYFRVKGLRRAPGGEIVNHHHLFTRITRREQADLACRPIPPELLEALEGQGKITADERLLATGIPYANALVAEGDGAGFTDRQPLGMLLESCFEARRRHTPALREFILIGAAGNMGTPESIAFPVGAGCDFVLLGSLQLLCAESDFGEPGRELLSRVTPYDFNYVPSFFDFEQGRQIQVLKFGTLFPTRAQRLAILFRAYPTLDSLPPRDIHDLEKNYFLCPLGEAAEKSATYFERHAPWLNTGADSDPKKTMARLFKWYLHRSFLLAKEGASGQDIHFQIWASPAIGAFNLWRKKFPALENSPLPVADLMATLHREWGHLNRRYLLQSQGIEVL